MTRVRLEEPGLDFGATVILRVREGALAFAKGRPSQPLHSQSPCRIRDESFQGRFPSRTRGLFRVREEGVRSGGQNVLKTRLSHF